MNIKNILYYSMIGLLLGAVLLNLIYPLPVLSEPANVGIILGIVFAIIFFKSEIYTFLTKMGIHDDRKTY